MRGRWAGGASAGISLHYVLDPRVLDPPPGPVRWIGGEDGGEVPASARRGTVPGPS